MASTPQLGLTAVYTSSTGIQCALNGDYRSSDHPNVPVTLEQLVADAVACRGRGARSVHLHPRRPGDGAIHRVPVEVIFEHNDAAAVELARPIDARVAVLERPRLWHGDARANWAVVDAGLAVGVDVRVGLEDTLIGRDGGPAPGNVAQVAETAPRMT